MPTAQHRFDTNYSYQVVQYVCPSAPPKPVADATVSRCYRLAQRANVANHRRQSFPGGYRSYYADREKYKLGRQKRGGQTSMSHLFFLDESGNAGINYLDVHQPFHVAAGVLLANSKRSAFTTVMRAQLAQSENEIKGAQLMRSASGQRRALAILGEIGRQGGVPFYVLMERRFSIAGKIVDVFLDPAHQDAVDWLPTSAIVEREALTQWLCDKLPDMVLQHFAQAYRCPSEANFTETLELILSAIADCDDPRLLMAFRGALAGVATIVQCETYGDDQTKHGDWAGLNVPAFSHVLRLADRFVDCINGTFEAIHDTTVQFERPFRRVAESISQSDASVADLRLPDGTIFRGLLRCCIGFRTETSVAEPGVQAADLVAATVAQVAKAAIRTDNGWSGELQRLADVSLPALDLTDKNGAQICAGIYASEQTKCALLARM